MLVGSNKKFLFAPLFCANVYCTTVYSQSGSFFVTHGNNLSSVAVLKLIAPGIAQLFYFRIYNRWG